MLPRFVRAASNRLPCVIATSLVIGCGDPSPAQPEPILCGPDEILQEDGSCFQPGVPVDLPCPPGELELAGGGCQAAGVPANGCGKGFVHEDQGCRAILPAEPCPFGQMAVPGETECHEVSSCGEGQWGDIPVEPDAQYVDQAYQGNDSDGSQFRPWKTIQEGIDNAAPGGMVAIAAGTYPEDVAIVYKRVRIWGRCPHLVEISGSGKYDVSLIVYAAQSSESEVHGLAVTSSAFGLTVSSAENVLLDRLWIHDVLKRGVNIQNEGSPTSVTVRNTLIENTGWSGVYLADAETTWEGIAVRDNGEGFAFVARNYESSFDDTNTTIRGSIFERCTNAAVAVAGTQMTVEDSVFREAQAGSEPAQGITASNDENARSNLTVRRCAFERNFGSSLNVLGATALIENTTVRDSQLDSMGLGGRGMAFADSLATMQRANATVRSSLVDNIHDIGIGVWGSDITLEGVLVRDMLPDGNFNGGDGIYVAPRGKDAERPKVTVRGSVLDRCRGTGISFFGSDGLVETSVVRDTLIGDDEVFGRGVSIEYFYQGKMSSDVTIRSCLVEKNIEFGVFIHGSRAMIESSTIRKTEFNKAGFGRGINVQGHPAIDLRSELFIRESLIDENNETGLFVSDSDVTVEDSIIRGTKPLWDLSFGDGVSLRYGSNVNFTRVAVERNARAGIASFGSRAKIQSSTIRCNAFDIEGEFSDGLPFSYDGSSGWQCSELRAATCTTLSECNVHSAGLVAPSSLTSPSSQP